MKVFKNILLNTNDNYLRIADIYFSTKIKEVRFRSDEINWTEISTKEKRKKVISQIVKVNYPQNIKVISGNFNLIIPGAIDPHVHFDTPGFEFREDFEHASTAAAFGGVTTIVDMPCTSIPAVTSQKNFQVKLKEVKERSLVDFAFWGGVSGTALTDISLLRKNIFDLVDAGVAGFKVYVTSGMKDFTELTYDEIEQVAKIIMQTDKPMAVHAEDKNLIINKKKYFQTKGINSWEAYCSVRNIRVESKAVEKLVEIAKKTKAKFHIVHLSSKAALDKIRKAQSENIQITTETCPQYLFFTQKDFENDEIRNYLKTAPPVKFEKDKIALWRGLKNGSIKFVTTDHAGTVPSKEKTSNNFWEVYGGIPGVEHRVPFLFSEGFLKGRLSLEQTVKLLSTNAAEFYKIDRKGKIEKNYDADFAVIDLWKSEKVKACNMHSKGKYTPFENVEFKASVEKTILRGDIIMDKKGNPEEKTGYGKFIKIKESPQRR
ncbi:allantoinase [bacterium BMS3Abin04]|nr:allantoinase [bacterium BMS3Abin04]